jgi:hypothetical protein
MFFRVAKLGNSPGVYSHFADEVEASDGNGSGTIEGEN